MLLEERKMGQLIDGVWHDTWYDTKSTGGKFQRSASAFRNWLTADGAPGPTGTGGFIAEKDRYHLYVSLACPWAHRTLIMRKLKGLEPFISVSVLPIICIGCIVLSNSFSFMSFVLITDNGLFPVSLFILYLIIYTVFSLCCFGFPGSWLCLKFRNA